MRRRPVVTLILAFCLSFAVAGLAPAQILIDNGVSGDGFWAALIADGGYSFSAVIDPLGPTLGPISVVYQLIPYVDPGIDGGGLPLVGSTIVTPAYVSATNQVTSEGSFAGPNGLIEWKAVSSIQAGSTRLNTAITFTSQSQLGAVRVIYYLDEDVLGNMDDELIVLGTPGAADFELLTLDVAQGVGVTQSAGYFTATNASYKGWAADKYSDLLALIGGTGAAFSVAGVVDTTSLPPTHDNRYSGRPAYGPADVTTAIAFDLAPAAYQASLNLALGGRAEEQLRTVPALGVAGLGVLLALLAAAGVVALRRA